MTEEKIIKEIEDDPVSLSDKIREGSVPFDILTDIIKTCKDIRPVIIISHLIHPDCTIDVFKHRYYYVLEETKWMSKDTILTKSPIFRYLEAIAFIMSCKEVSSSAIEGLYKTNSHDFNKLIKNPHISTEFKIIYFNVTGDPSYLPQEINDCFVF